MHTLLIRRYLTLLLLSLMAAACQTVPKTADKNAVITSALSQDDAMKKNDIKLVDTIETKLAQQQAISEAEAVIYALTHNPGFQMQLVDLKIAASDLQTAGLLPNPEFLFSFGVSNKPYRYALDFPLDALWQRPIKLRKMKHIGDATALRLTQAGLDLMKAVRIAYAQTVLAEEALNATKSAATLAKDIVTLSEKRLALGDISAATLVTLKQQAALAAQVHERATYDLAIKKAVLRHQLGLSEAQADLVLSPTLMPTCEAKPVAQLQSMNVAKRPDVLAAEQAVLAAKEDVKLSKVGWFKFIGSADATSGQKTGHELSPTVRTTVPVLNRNGGAISRAEAALEKATLNLTVTKQNAMLATQQAFLQYQQSCHVWQRHQSQILPAVKQSNQLANLAYQDGDVSYLDTLQSKQALTLAQVESVKLKASLINQWAELRRNVSQNSEKPLNEGMQNDQ